MDCEESEIFRTSPDSTVWYMYQGLEIAPIMAAVTRGWLESAHKI